MLVKVFFYFPKKTWNKSPNEYENGSHKLTFAHLWINILIDFIKSR